MKLNGVKNPRVAVQALNPHAEFGNEEKEVSLLGFGCMRFPTLENNEVDIKEAKRMNKRAST